MRNKKDFSYSSTFPKRLRSLLDDRRVTQGKLAEHLGKTAQTVSQYANGISEPSYTTLVEIANFFDVTTDYLLGTSDIQTSNPDIAGVCKYTGLTQQAVENLSGCFSSFVHNNVPFDGTQICKQIDSVLEKENAPYFTPIEITGDFGEAFRYDIPDFISFLFCHNAFVQFLLDSCAVIENVKTQSELLDYANSIMQKDRLLQDDVQFLRQLRAMLDTKSISIETYINSANSRMHAIWDDVKKKYGGEE